MVLGLRLRGRIRDIKLFRGVVVSERVRIYINCKKSKKLKFP
jgi:hypothetical protein